MEITIIDGTFDKETGLIHGNMLWSAAVFAKRINLISSIESILIYGLEYQNMDEETRVKFIKIAMVNWNTKMTPEKFEIGYQNYIKVKRRKHKTKQEILFINEKKRILEIFHENMLDYMVHIEKSFNIGELHSLFSLPRKGVICLYPLNAFDKTDFSPLDVEQIITTILHEYEIPLFSDKVERYINGDFYQSKTAIQEFTENDNTEKESEPTPEVRVFREKFLEFISPASLTFNKLEIIRNEFVTLFEPINEKLVKFKSLFGDKNNEYPEINDAEDLYRHSLMPMLKNFQGELVNNIYFQQIENSGEETDSFILYFCGCSTKDLLVLFEKVSEIPKVTIDRIREELAEKINLNRTTFFLYLKNKKYE